VTLWPHQVDAVEFALARRGTLLACGMGTGKTRMALEIRRRINAARVLVVAPLGVVTDGAWNKNAARFDADALVIALEGSVAKKTEQLRRELRSSTQTYKVFVTNWDSIWRPPLFKTLCDARFDLVVFDESHRAKSHTGRASKAAADIAKNAARVLALTGTPMPHSPLDIFAQMRLIDPTIFGSSFVRFRAYYATVDTRGGFPKICGFQRQDDLARRMGQVTFQVDRSVLTLPDAIHTDIEVELPASVRQLYAATELDIAVELEAGVVDMANALVKTTRLQQITSGFVTVQPLDYEATTTAIQDLHTVKRDRLVELLEDLGDEPVVVFCRFRRDLEAVHDAAREAGTNCLELSGDRKEHPMWKDGHARVLAVQIRAGAEGVDLTRAAHCVFYSVSHSLGDYQQALARIHRPGQSRSVNYYHFIARDTIDSAIYSALHRKASVVEAVVQRLQQAQDNKRKKLKA